MIDRMQQLALWLEARENEHLELKEAKHGFHFEKLAKYCAALANEGGGHMVLGVTDKRPRRIVGTEAFGDLERTKGGLVRRLALRIDAVELQHPDGRVVVFSVPSRPIGRPIAVDGAYFMRAGEDLVPMTPDHLQRIILEAGPDYSAELVPSAQLADLDGEAMESFRVLWHRRSGEPRLLQASPQQLLEDAELSVGGTLTYAALILFGTHRTLGRHLAQAEVVFEYRSSERPGPAQQRVDLRRGFLTYFDQLWRLVDTRNDTQHYQDGLFMQAVPTFNEGAIREAILNAVSHRDYRLAGSVFVRQFPSRIEIVSPGGFPAGVSADTILWRQNPRNRRLAEALARCGFVERAGQGADRIFEACIREGKVPPDFSGSDEFQVSLTLHGEVKDPQFIRFLERVCSEQNVSFSTVDLYLLDLIHRGQRTPPELATRTAHLLDTGVIERAARARYTLSRRFYRFLGQRGQYTRRQGLDRETNKMLLLKHITGNRVEGSRMEDLEQVLPALTRNQIWRLLHALRSEGKIRSQGATRSARWYPADQPEAR